MTHFPARAGDPATAPSVLAIILNWNGKTDTLECLESVRELRYPRYQVLVVDNASSDGSVQAIAARHPEVEIEFFEPHTPALPKSK